MDKEETPFCSRTVDYSEVYIFFMLWLFDKL